LRRDGLESGFRFFDRALQSWHLIRTAGFDMRAIGLAALLAGLAACGCGQLAPMRIASTRGNAPVVAVLKSPPAGAVELGQVSATTCLNRLWDSRPGWDAALDSLKQEAARKGANGLTEVRYEEASVLLCASALRVSGTALKLP
jgi:hypothetical protein